MRHSIFAISTTIGLITSGILGSCGKSDGSPTVSYSAERDNIEHRELVSIDSALPLIHSESRLYMSGDTLLICDNRSRGNLFYAYDVVQEKYIGSFGKYGAGPGEITNFGIFGINSERGILYGVDYNRWVIYGFNIAEALSDSTYHPFKVMDFYKGDGTRPICREAYLNDSTVYCAVAVPSADYRAVGYHLGRFNPLTGKSILLDSINPDPFSGWLCPNPAKNEIIELSLDFDRIRFFDFDGNLKRTIYGPDYKDYNRRITYYGSPIILGDKIYATYQNGDFNDPDLGHQIIVMDLEGNYVKSIDLGVHVANISYNPTTRRIYAETWDEPQFGYFKIDD